MHKFNLGIEAHVSFSLTKLFCRCVRNPEVNYSTSARRVLVRDLNYQYFQGDLKNTTLDFELTRRTRHNYYLANKSSACLLELGETFPRINQETFRKGLQLAAYFVDINEVVYVMRKLIGDGSIASGYQRTMLLGISSYCEPIGVPISAVYLEEDACSILNLPGGNKMNFLDRQGSPLLEIVTSVIPCESVSEATNKVYQLGYFLMSLLPERIASPIRQDLNISIGGLEGKVELKGVDSKSSITAAIESEVQRQELLLRARRELELSRVTPRTLQESLLAGALSELNLDPQIEQLISEETLEVVGRLGDSENTLLASRIGLFFEGTVVSETRTYEPKNKRSVFTRGKSATNQLYPESDLLYINTLNYRGDSQRSFPRGFPELSLQDLARVNANGLLSWLYLLNDQNYSYQQALEVIDNFRTSLNSINENSIDRETLLSLLPLGKEILTVALRNYLQIPLTHILNFHDKLTEEEIKAISSLPEDTGFGSLMRTLRNQTSYFFVSHRRLALIRELFSQRQTRGN